MSDADKVSVFELFPSKGEAMGLAEEVQVVLAADRCLTPDEPFMTERPAGAHIYAAACDWVCQHLRNGRAASCLVVGSTPFEANRLDVEGWTVTYVDARDVPQWSVNGHVYKADAGDLPFAAASFDALSSTCVLCHVGLGRYGDPVCAEGDTKALHEFHRVLKPGARAAVTWGPCLPALNRTITLGTVHRNYAIPDALAKARAVGFKVLDMALWCSIDKHWLTLLEAMDQVWADPTQGGRRTCCYLATLLEKA